MICKNKDCSIYKASIGKSSIIYRSHLSLTERFKKTKKNYSKRLCVVILKYVKFILWVLYTWFCARITFQDIGQRTRRIRQEEIVENNLRIHLGNDVNEISLLCAADSAMLRDYGELFSSHNIGPIFVPKVFLTKFPKIIDRSSYRTSFDRCEAFFFFQ